MCVVSDVHKICITHLALLAQETDSEDSTRDIIKVLLVEKKYDKTSCRTHVSTDRGCHNKCKCVYGEDGSREAASCWALTLTQLESVVILISKSYFDST